MAGSEQSDSTLSGPQGKARDSLSKPFYSTIVLRIGSLIGKILASKSKG